ncbi:hypothetical protein B9Z19DRAFT_283602 [Tuber borchii]|uniref:Uncharacterized protein n=1 Tax=Tuber borchii TaxID=42251 RepID=A0A2T6ZKX5_TUBBO|nr:hypothetical protein B9Z19DRAFT_283602 [Tuber borchii]
MTLRNSDQQTSNLSSQIHNPTPRKICFELIFPFCIFLTRFFASAIITQEITTVANSLNADDSSLATLKIQTSAFTITDCSVLSWLLTLTIMVENWTMQATTGIMTDSRSFPNVNPKFGSSLLT